MSFIIESKFIPVQKKQTFDYAKTHFYLNIIIVSCKKILIEIQQVIDLIHIQYTVHF